MIDYKKYINALRKCAKEHEGDKTFTGQIVISDLCRDTANLLEELEQELTTKNDLEVDTINRQAINGYIDYILSHGMGKKKSFDFIKKFVTNLPSVTPQETSRNMEEIEEVINCDVDAETKCKMISNILTAKLHYFGEPQESEVEYES